MPNPPTISGEYTPQSNLDWQLPEQKLKQVTDFLSAYAGKKGFNPYVYYYNNVKPLEDKYRTGDRSVELYKSIMGIKLEEPSVDKNPTIGGIIGPVNPLTGEFENKQVKNPLNPIGDNIAWSSQQQVKK